MISVFLAVQNRLNEYQIFPGQSVGVYVRHQQGARLYPDSICKDVGIEICRCL